MTSKEFLQRPMRLRWRIDALKLQKEQYEELANSIPGGNYDKPVVQKTRSNEAPFIKWIDKIIDVDNKIAEFEKELKDLINSSIKMSQTIEKPEC